MTGEIYERLESGVREADLHFVNWLGGPQVDSRESTVAAPASGEAGVSAPTVQPRAAFAAGERRAKGMDLGLSGKKALVTAASRGIGLSIARQLADDGCAVAICARSEGGLESAVKDLEQRGVRVFAKAVDVSDGSALRAFVAEAARACPNFAIEVRREVGATRVRVQP